jgi:valyl-tRNA synthetase
LVDKWIISRSNRLVSEVDRLMEAYQFGEAGRQIQEFLWNEFCDWYIEMSKVRLYGDDIREQNAARQVLVYVLERSLRLLHPFMPFVTETLWQSLPHEGPALIVASWPQEGWVDEEAESVVGSLMDVVRAIRNARAEFHIQAGKRIPAIIVAGAKMAFFDRYKKVLCTLAHVDEGALTLVESLAEKPTHALILVEGGVETYLPLKGVIDLEAEQMRVAVEMESLTQRIAEVEIRLRNENFVTKAPGEVVQRERDKRAELRERWGTLRDRLQQLGGL